MKRMRLSCLLWLPVLLSLLVGCGSGNNNIAFIKPPMPVLSALFPVNTPNYYYLYNQGGSPAFSLSSQFRSDLYPIPVSYQQSTTPPTGLVFATETENSILCWSRADPRVCIISGAPTTTARINMVLELDISSSQPNIIGLTSISNKSPGFIIEIATRYSTGQNPDGTPIYQSLSADDIKKTIAHELGHAFGLGHSPNQSDLMYYKSNDNQGTSYANFLTYGDATAIWTTLNARGVSWQHFPIITQAAGFTKQAQPTVRALEVPSRGPIVDVYTKE